MNPNINPSQGFFGQPVTPDGVNKQYQGTKIVEKTPRTVLPVGEYIAVLDNAELVPNRFQPNRMQWQLRFRVIHPQQFGGMLVTYWMPADQISKRKRDGTLTRQFLVVAALWGGEENIGDVIDPREKVGSGLVIQIQHKVLPDGPRHQVAGARPMNEGEQKYFQQWLAAKQQQAMAAQQQGGIAPAMPTQPMPQQQPTQPQPQMPNANATPTPQSTGGVYTAPPQPVPQTETPSSAPAAPTTPEGNNQTVSGNFADESPPDWGEIQKYMENPF